MGVYIFGVMLTGFSTVFVALVNSRSIVGVFNTRYVLYESRMAVVIK